MLKKLFVFLEMIKFGHSVFALPFALISMLVAAGGVPSFPVVFWILVAVVSARTAAMAFNRIVDVPIDAKNPRTKNRALVTGELSMTTAWLSVVVSVVLFVMAAGMLNSLALLLSVPTLMVLLGYSLMKRVTSLVHGVLGLALGIAPIGAWIAVTGELAILPCILGLGVLFWVMGFDLLYACQDYESDKRDPRVHSIPKRVGIRRAFALARLSHLEAFLLFLLFWMFTPQLGGFFLLGLLGTGTLMLYQHSLLRPDDLSRINQAFFTSNGIISLLLFAMTCLDVLL